MGISGLAGSSPGVSVPLQVATVQVAGRKLQEGWKLRPLEREVFVGGSTYTHRLARARAAINQPPLLVSSGVIRALRHQGLLKGVAGVSGTEAARGEGS